MQIDDDRETTRQLFHGVLHQATKWSPARQIVANVFNAYYTRALSAQQVIAVAKAVEALSDSGDEYITDALAFFVRQKVLRSRKGDSGVRLYEVNY